MGVVLSRDSESRQNERPDARQSGQRFLTWFLVFAGASSSVRGHMNSRRQQNKTSIVGKSPVLTGKIVLAFLLFFPFAASAVQNSSKTEEADTVAIKQIVTAYTDAWNSRNPHALAILFTEDCDYVTVTGGNTHGRQALEEMFASILTGALKNTHRTDSVKRVRFVTPEIASVDDYWVMTGASPERPYREGLYTWIVTKQNGHWLVSVHHAADFNVSQPSSPKN